MLQELFRDEAIGGEDSKSEASSELLHDSELRMQGGTFVGKKQMTHYTWMMMCLAISPMLLERCLSCLSVCNLGVLWQNGRVLSRIMYCGHSAQYSHLVFVVVIFNRKL